MNRIIFYLAFLGCLVSCRRTAVEEVAFPLETQTGLNTFGCYIDGKQFIPFTTVFGNVKPINVYYTPAPSTYYKAGFLSIQGVDARYNLDFAGNVLIQKIPVSQPGEYALTHVANCANPYDCDGGGYYNAKEARTYFIESGKLTISNLDTVNRIISGKFFFTAKDSLGNRKEVSNGVFHLKYTN